MARRRIKELTMTTKGAERLRTLLKLHKGKVLETKGEQQRFVFNGQPIRIIPMARQIQVKDPIIGAPPIQPMVRFPFEARSERIKKFIVELEAANVADRSELEGLSDPEVVKFYTRNIPEVVAIVEDHRGNAAGIGSHIKTIVTKGGNGKQ